MIWGGGFQLLSVFISQLDLNHSERVRAVRDERALEGKACLGWH